MTFLIKQYNATIIKIKCNTCTRVGYQITPEVSIMLDTFYHKHRITLHLIIYMSHLRLIITLKC